MFTLQQFSQKASASLPPAGKSLRGRVSLQSPRPRCSMIDRYMSNQYKLFIIYIIIYIIQLVFLALFRQRTINTKLGRFWMQHTMTIYARYLSFICNAGVFLKNLARLILFLMGWDKDGSWTPRLQRPRYKHTLAVAGKTHLTELYDHRSGGRRRRHEHRNRSSRWREPHLQCTWGKGSPEVTVCGSWSWAVEPYKLSSSGKKRRYQLENCSRNTKRMSRTIEKDLVVDGIESSTEIKNSEQSYLAYVSIGLNFECRRLSKPVLLILPTGCLEGDDCSMRNRWSVRAQPAQAASKQKSGWRSGDSFPNQKDRVLTFFNTGMTEACFCGEGRVPLVNKFNCFIIRSTSLNC